MNFRAFFLATAFVAASTASAQQVVRPVTLAPTTAPTVAPDAAAPAQDTPSVAPGTRVDAAGVEPMRDPAQAIDQIDRTAILETEVKRLREANRKLKADNAALAAQVDGYRSKGGSLVHAYCPTRTLSRTTAGDEQDCAPSGYTCEAVSGQCRTACQVGDHCATGYTCDTGTRQCVYTAGGVPGSDD